MRFFVARPLLYSFITFISLFSGVAASSTQQRVIDPLFGLKFDPGKAAFDKLTTLSRDCPAVARSDRWERQALLFASASDAKGDLLLLGGLLVPRHGRPMADTVGAIVRLTPGRCELIGPAAEPFEDPEAYTGLLSPQELESLADNAAARFERAFGGKTGLFRLARQQHVALRPPSKPALAQAMADAPR